MFLGEIYRMKRVMLHLAFWIIYVIQDSMMIFTWVKPSYAHFSDDELYSIALADSLVMLIPKMLLCYFILYVSIRKMRTEQSSLTRVVGGIIIAFSVAILLSRFLLKYFVNPYIFKNTTPGDPILDLRSILTAFMSIACVVGLAAFIKFVRIQIASKEREKDLVKQKLETELKFLRNQTNPHFLFNTLNNIYGLARRQSVQTADAVMKLSQLLRFMLYESKEDLIGLNDEIKVLETYIDLEKIRFGEILTLEFEKNIDNETERIAPLLLLPFVENAFKHGAGESRFDAVISINLKLSDGQLTFSVINTRESGPKEAVMDNIGLSNVKRQLELMYREYDLQINNESALFSILLTINLRTYAKI